LQALSGRSEIRWYNALSSTDLPEETILSKAGNVPQFFLDLVQLSERGTHHICGGMKHEVAKGAARGNAVAGGCGHKPRDGSDC
jgi:hypothetical protein